MLRGPGIRGRTASPCGSGFPLGGSRVGRARSEKDPVRHLASVVLLAVALVALGLFLGSAAEAAPKIRALGGGAWCWFGDPRGLHHNNRTYIGWIDQEGDVKVASYDHTTRLRTTAVLRWSFERNDHATPSLHVRPDGRLMVFYSGHNGSKMYYRVSEEPGNVTSWHAERTVPTNTSGSLGYTYPNPVQLSAENDRLWLFWRGGNWQPNFSTSTDGGNSWSTAQTLVNQSDHRPYIKFSSNKTNRIHFAFTQGHPRNINTNIYHAYYRNGAFYRANGTRIKSLSSLPLSPTETDKIYDTDYRSWVHDIALDPYGRPIIVFAVFPSTLDHRYYYARWTGLSWRRYQITPAGGTISDSREPHYSGGITLDHEDPSVVYLSREVNGMHEVETWRTSDGGPTWSRAAVTSSSSVDNVRPISPRGLQPFDDDMSVVWMRGNYNYYLTYQTDITTRLMNGGNLPPIADATAFPRTGQAPLSVQFDGTGSRDSDGSVVDWEWDFGDGSRGSGSTSSHTYSSPGRYFGKLTVTDEAGGKDIFVTEVVVG